jgi:hypothetical protein
MARTASEHDVGRIERSTTILQLHNVITEQAGMRVMCTSMLRVLASSSTLGDDHADEPTPLFAQVERRGLLRARPQSSCIELT